MNKKNYDKTTWYSIDYEALNIIEDEIKPTGQVVQSQQIPTGQLVHMEVDNLSTPIPETTTENKTPAAPMEQPACVSDNKSCQPVLLPTSGKKTASHQKMVSDHAWFTTWWIYAYEIVIGEKYAYTKKDAGQVKQLLQLIGLGDTVTRACVYLSLPPTKRFPRGSPTIGGLLHQVNEVCHCDDELIDNFTDLGLLPDLQKIPKLKNFKPWEAQTSRFENRTLILGF